MSDDTQFFVMLNWQNGEGVSPMTDDDEHGNSIVALFDDIDNARWAAENNRMGSAFGYEIFQRGSGYP